MENDNKGLLEGLSFGKPAETTETTTTAIKTETTQQQSEEGKIDLIPITETTQQTQETKQQEEVKFSESEVIKKLFGENSQYKTIEDIAKLRVGELLPEHAKLKGQYSELDKANRTLQDRLAVTSSPQYQNALKYAHFAKETQIDDPVIFRKIETLDPGKLDPISALVLRDVCETPSEIENMAQLKEYYMRKYHLGDYATETEKEDGTKVKVEDELDKVALRRDAVSATKFLTGLKDKINAFKPEVEDVAAKREENLKAWEPFVNTQTDPYLKQIDLPVKEIKGVKVDVAYQLTPEDITFVKQDMLSIAKEMNVELNKENLTAIYGVAMKDLREKNFDKILTVFGEKMFSNIEMVLQSKYKNFSFATELTPRKSPEELKEVGPSGSVQLSDVQKRSVQQY